MCHDMDGGRVWSAFVQIQDDILSHCVLSGMRCSRSRRALEASCGYKVVEAVVAKRQAKAVRPIDDVLSLSQPVEGLGKRATIVGGLLVASELRAPTKRIVNRYKIIHFNQSVKEAVELLVVPREREIQTDKGTKPALTRNEHGTVVSDRRLK